MSDPVPRNAKSTKTKLEMSSRSDLDTTKRNSKISTGMPTVNSHFLIASERLDKLTRRVIAPYAQIERKGQKSEERKGSYLDINRFNVFLDDTVDLDSLLYETAMVLKTITRSSGVFVYTVNSLKNEIVLMPHYTKDPGRHEVNVPIEEGQTAAAHAAMTKEHLLISDVQRDHRFADGLRWIDAKTALCMPIVKPDGDCYAVLELYRTFSEPYDENTVYTVLSMACWAGAAVHQAQARVTLQKKALLNTELITLLQSYFCDIASIDTMLTDMLQIIKSFLGAMRSSFYIIDRDHVGDFIQADMWDDGWTSEKSTIPRKRAKVNLSVERSPASMVANTGKFLNIADAYKDPRFSKEIDPTTGAVMRSCLASPILDKNGVIGVVQVTNKTNGQPFDDQDELIYDVFMSYCALIVYFFRMETKKRFHENLNDVLNELIKLHMKPCRHDVEELMETNGVILPPSNFKSFDFHITESTSRDYMPGLICYMFHETFADRNFDKTLLAEFTLTALSAYRPNAYHNAEHAFCFTHTMFLVLSNNNGYFDFVECAALMLGGLCHDIDHPGLNNNFLMLAQHPLAKMYAASTLEHHHAYVAKHLVENKQILSKLSIADRERILDEMNYAILCTDLAVYFQIRSRLTPILTERSFDWTSTQHRKMLKGIMMTTCDLSGTCKPFGVAKKIAENVYDEFYKQGDLERQMGYTPLSMMDRRRRVNQPAEQIQFLSVVVLPSLLLLQAVFPNTQPLIDNCKKTQESWREEIEIRGQKLWRQEDSVYSVNRGKTAPTPESTN